MSSLIKSHGSLSTAIFCFLLHWWDDSDLGQKAWRTDLIRQLYCANCASTIAWLDHAFQSLSCLQEKAMSLVIPVHPRKGKITSALGLCLAITRIIVTEAMLLTNTKSTTIPEKPGLSLACVQTIFQVLFVYSLAFKPLAGLTINFKKVTHFYFSYQENKYRIGNGLELRDSELSSAQLWLCRMKCLFEQNRSLWCTLNKLSQSTGTCTAHTYWNQNRYETKPVAYSCTNIFRTYLI